MILKEAYDSSKDFLLIFPECRIHELAEGYYADFTDDYIPPSGEALSGSIGGVERGLGVLTGLSGTDAENVGTEWDVGGVVHKTRTGTADRDGLLLVHVSAGSERLIQGLRSKVKLDYAPDFVLQNSGELESSGKFLVTDDLIYDKLSNGTDKHFVWSGQSDNFKLQGSGSDGVMYFYGYNLNVPWDEMYGERGTTNRSDISSDVYLNGQKMTSGINYTIDYIGGSASSGFGLKFDMDTLNGATGTVHFAATVSGMEQFNHHTGVGASFLQAPFGLMREQVWVNGVRQERGDGKDYVKRSKFSRSASGKRLGAKTSSIYSTNVSTAGSSGSGTY